MFFPERIKSISSNDRVLEVGPGATPFPRADVLLDRIFLDQGEAKKQRGGLDSDGKGKTIFYYDGDRFPFKDKEFDYVVCSHVIEHVADVEFFVSELSRVASRGYIEYPTVYYEYLYNFSVHLNFVKLRSNGLYYLPKKDTPLDEFLSVHKFFYRTLQMGHTQLVDAFKETMFDGFEWYGTLAVIRAESISDLVFHEVAVPRYEPKELSRLRLTAGRIRSAFKRAFMGST